MIGETNKKKEIIIDSLDDIIEQIDIGMNYKITGIDYDIIISPINSYKSLNYSYIDLGECENIIREKYNLNSNEIITILAFEINPLNEKVLGNQIEYTIFDEKKREFNLSFCQDESIIIDYKIINSSIINRELVSYFAEYNIDIFNKDDDFFNDQCYPFSLENKDIILKDRINDIYQNYSLCEDNCEYQSMDIESMYVKCKCPVKTEIDLEVKPPTFYDIILDSFKDSNFGVIICYKEVFNLKNKLKNCGFLISLIILILHIPLFIIYFIYKLKSVENFVFEEMKKNNYLNQNNNNENENDIFVKRSERRKKTDIFDKKQIQNALFGKRRSKERKKTDIFDIKKTEIDEKDKNEIDEKDKAEIVEIKHNEFNEIKQTENLIKVKKRKISKYHPTKVSRNTINYNIEDKLEDNKIIIPFDNDKDYDKLFLTPKKNKKIVSSCKNVCEENNNNDSQSMSSISKFKNSKPKRIKKVNFNLPKASNSKKDESNHKKNLNNSSRISIFNPRRNERTTKSKTAKIFERLLGNEQAKKFPGFYNLIHVNANNVSFNRPLDSKYILDNFDYENAIKYDKRSFWRVLFICLLSKETILNTFFFKSPLELQSIRLCLFLFSNSCDLALNALFYLNDNISDRYHYNGSNLFWYSLLNNLTISITSTLVGFLLIKFLSFLSNSKDDIVDIFRKEEEKMRNDKDFKIDSTIKSNILKQLNIIYRKLKIKIISFIIMEILILLFFFYYMIAFCEVYMETQISWLADSGVSFLIAIPIEICSSLLMAVFYYISIRYKNKCIYCIVMFFYSLD